MERLTKLYQHWQVPVPKPASDILRGLEER
jgi:hypothetical protein